MKKLTLNSDIYSCPVIEAAIFAYKNLATISVCKQDGQTILLFDECRFDPSLTIKEFENVNLLNDSFRKKGKSASD